MSAREPSPSPSLDEVQRLLCRTLARLEADVSAAMRGQTEEPSLLRRLDRDRAELEDRVDVLRRTLSRLADVAPVDLNWTTREVLDEVLFELEKPLALRAQWAGDLPCPSVAEESLRSLLRRAISLIVRHARSGDRVAFRTWRDGDEVILSVAVEPREGDGQDAASEPFEVLAVRCRSLGEFVHELGGRFVLSDERGIRLEIRLWAGANTPSP